MNRTYKKIIASFALTLSVLFSESCSCGGAFEAPLNPGPRKNVAYTVYKSDCLTCTESAIGSIYFDPKTISNPSGGTTSDTSGVFQGTGLLGIGTYARTKSFEYLQLTDNDPTFATFPVLNLRIIVDSGSELDNANFVGIDKNNSGVQYYFKSK